jgi:DNA-directed RNA polymerase subunit omega
MIEALKSDDVVNKVGGRFKLAVLVQKRLVDVTFGAPLLVERGSKTLMEAVIQEVLEGKITLEIAERKRVAAPKAAPAAKEAAEEDAE